MMKKVLLLVLIALLTISTALAQEKCSNESEFCGGIAGVLCCSGLKCQLEGTYPDAGGKCIKGMVKCTDSDGGKDYYAKGTATGYENSQLVTSTDGCRYDGITLAEVYCEGSELKVEQYECPNGCEDGACIREPNQTLNQPYIIEFGDPSFHKPQLYDKTFQTSITCNKNNLQYDCEDDIIGSRISRAYAYIKDSSGAITQQFDLIKEAGTSFSGTFDYDSLTGEVYTIGVYAEDINGIKKDIPSYSIFSGQGWNLCQTNLDCLEYHSCINNKCMLNENINYNLGLVYVYYNEDTYNPNWKTEIDDINQKVIDGIKETTNNKVNPTIKILGEVQTDIFCWNPATIGGKFRNTVTGSEFYFQMPNSDFSSTGIGLTGYEIVESYCDNCIIDGDIYKIDCEDVLSYSNLWQSNRLDMLNQQISQELSFNFDNYEGVYIIFGKLGHVLPEEGGINLQYRCQGMRVVIGGYANLIMAENSLKSGGLIDCKITQSTPYYDKMGWNKMVHEVLHRFGAVDVYDTGPVFGYDPSFHRSRARLIDPRTDESIMGNEEKECIDEGEYETDGNICTQQELDDIYLDKYNKQKIGVNPAITPNKKIRLPKKIVTTEITAELQEECIPEWECKLEPAECPPEGIQNKVCYDIKCGTEKKREEVVKCIPGTCTGCLVNMVCYPITTRMLRDGTPSYCDVTKKTAKQKAFGAPCQNSYECKSNECSDGECISLKKELEKTQSLLKKILAWLKGIF